MRTIVNSLDGRYLYRRDCGLVRCLPAIPPIVSLVGLTREIARQAEPAPSKPFSYRRLPLMPPDLATQHDWLIEDGIRQVTTLQVVFNPEGWSRPFVRSGYGSLLDENVKILKLRDLFQKCSGKQITHAIVAVSQWPENQVGWGQALKGLEIWVYYLPACDTAQVFEAAQQSSEVAPFFIAGFDMLASPQVSLSSKPMNNGERKAIVQLNALVQKANVRNQVTWEIQCDPAELGPLANIYPGSRVMLDVTQEMQNTPNSPTELYFALSFDFGIEFSAHFARLEFEVSPRANGGYAYAKLVKIKSPLAIATFMVERWLEFLN